MAEGRNKSGWIVLVMGACVAAAGAYFYLLYAKTTTTRAIHGARYLEGGDGAIVVVEHGTFTTRPDTGQSSSYNPRSTSTFHLYSHRAADGTFLASRKIRDGRIAGHWGARIWLVNQGRATLLDASTMEVIAAHADLERMVRNATGGSFELTSSTGLVNPYTGHLAIRVASGVQQWISPAPSYVEDGPEQKMPPDGWECGSIGSGELIHPTALVCLPPEAAPVTSLVKSKASALEQDKELPPLLSAVHVEWANSKVLWTKPLSDLVASGDGEELWLLRAQLLESGKVLLMVRRGDLELQLVTIDPANGDILESRNLFEKHAPGKR